MKVPFFDLQAQYIEIKPEVDPKLAEFLEAGSYIGGEYLKNFEETKITGNKVSFIESFISSPQYETTLVFILGFALEAM